MKVHATLGPGFLEEVYKNALLLELGKAGMDCEKEVPLDVVYDGVCVGRYQADIVVEKRLILELKSVAALVAKHEAQLVNYLSATGLDDGLLLNFGAPSLQFKHKYRVWRPKR
jgi:GxxExxY protein